MTFRDWDYAYRCPFCKGVYIKSHPALRYLVFHSPGECCHIYDKKLNEAQLSTTENASNGEKEAATIRP